MTVFPVMYWAILSILYTVTATGVIEVVTTNAHCHLTMRWINAEPNAHLFQDWDRGTLTLKEKLIATCWWNNKEQQEYGDTTIHTFIDEPWPFCETRWFFFFGTVNGEYSPSESPLFHYHRQIQQFESYLVKPVTYREFIFGDRWKAQTFTCHVPHTIKQVTLSCYKSSKPAKPKEMYVGIRNCMVTGRPIGGDLCLAYLNANSFKFWLPGVYYTFTFSLGYNCELGKIYAIVFRDPEGDGTNYVIVEKGQQFPGYPYGSAWTSFNGGIGWSEDDTRWDYLFAESGTLL